MSCVHKKNSIWFKRIDWQFYMYHLYECDQKKSIGKPFRNLLPKTKSKPTNAFFKFRSELKKILNDEVLYIEVFPHAHSTCKSAKRELFTFLMIFMSEEVAMILSQKQFFRPRASTQVLHSLQEELL